MHIPGNFHLHDINKYISAILLPAIFLQGVQSLIIPMTMADDVVSSDIVIVSELLDVSNVIENEVVTTQPAILTGTLE